MTTRVELAGRVRAELGDGGPGLVWADSLVYGWLGEGLQQLSLDLPPLKSTALMVFAGVRQFSMYGLGVGPKGVRSVEYPDGQVLAQGDTRRQGENFPASSGSQFFDNCWEFLRKVGDAPELWLRYAPSGSQSFVTVWYYGTYAVPGSDSAQLDLGAFDENLLVWFVCARALAWLESQRGKRGTMLANGPQGGASYYERLYKEGISGRKRGRVRVGVVSC